MSVYGKWPVKNGDVLEAVRRLLIHLLEVELVVAVLVPVETKNGRSVMPTLIRDPDQIARANPLLPVLPINGARMASLITRYRSVSNGKYPANGRIAVVMRPCELRATVELAKLRQVDYASLLTVGVDCLGTYEITDWQAMESESAEYFDSILDAMNRADPESPLDRPYRQACKICATPVAWNVDMNLHFIGVNGREGILVETTGESLLTSLGLTTVADPLTHQEAVRDVVEVRQNRRHSALDIASARLQAGTDGMPGLTKIFENCQRCLNCTVACPICYCKTCLFRTETFNHRPEHYLEWADRKGAARLPGDAITFQLTRFIHISASCIGCGLCTSACPASIPVDTIFQAVGRQTQALFDYIPGRDLEEPLPATTYREEEFANLGETVE